MIEPDPTRAPPSRRRLGRAAAAVLLVAGLAAAGLASAAPAGAQPAPTRGGAAACARAERQWSRLVTANTRARAAFAKAQALQNGLIANGRARLASRLDVRLAYLRSLHNTYTNLVSAIALRVQGRCSASPPQLPSY